MTPTEYETRISAVLASLGIPLDYISGKNLPAYYVAQELVTVAIDADGREHALVPDAAKAWRLLQDAARQDQIELEIVSAFRGIEEQVDIIREKIERAMPMQLILSLSAPPGYSEHHTGCAVDINTPGCVAREAPFEDTDAFRWLTANAGRFGYTLSYPRGNRWGFTYEPWHWFFRR